MGEPCKDCGHDHDTATEYTRRNAAFELEQLAERLGEDPKAWLGAAQVMVAIAYEEQVAFDMSDKIVGGDIDEAEAAKQGGLLFSAILTRFAVDFSEHPVGVSAYARALADVLRQSGASEDYTTNFKKLTGQG